MGLLSNNGLVDAATVPYLNTGSLLDFATGTFKPGVNGEMILDGGLAPTNGVMGRPQTFKSTLMEGYRMNAMARYAGSEGVTYDSEMSLKKDRLLRMVDLHHGDPAARAALMADLEVRQIITDATQFDVEGFFDQVRQLAEDKMKHAKDYMVETPFLDARTGKPQLMMVPTFVDWDSWSNSRSQAVLDILAKHAASDSDTNMVFMKEGLIKTKIMNQIPSLAVRAGLCVTMSAHIGNKYEMNPYAPSSKDLQYMKQGDTVKNVGSGFLFLVSNVIETRGAKVMQTDKMCEYPYANGSASPTEMNQVTAVLSRCKNNASGAVLSPVVSQSNGYENALTNYDFLRAHDYFGLGGSKQALRPVLLPDATLNRTQAASKLRDPKIARAVELMAQLLYVQKYWSWRDMPVPFGMKPEELGEKLLASGGYAIDDILASRGWWTYGANDQPYLSIFDVLAMIIGTYQPKFWAVKPAGAANDQASKKAAKAA